LRKNLKSEKLFFKN